MEDKQRLFTGTDLRKMIIPLFLEQLLVMLVGIADTLVVSYAGKAAVSGVSLVNQFNTIFIFLFTALASGGAIVISQYIGRKDLENAVAFPFSGALSSGLRAAGDVRFTMIVSILSTIVVRLLLSWVLGMLLDLGVIGIALAMAADWVVRAVIFLFRLRGGKWKNFWVI